MKRKQRKCEKKARNRQQKQQQQQQQQTRQCSVHFSMPLVTRVESVSTDDDFKSAHWGTWYLESAKSTCLEEDSSKLEMEMEIEDVESTKSTCLEEDHWTLDMEIEDVRSVISRCLEENHRRRARNYINFDLLTSTTASLQNSNIGGLHRCKERNI